MKWSSAILVLSASAALFFSGARGLAQPAAVSHATDFTNVEYYAQPNQTQMKSRLSGTEAQPLAGELLIIKQLKLEMFSTNGYPQAVVEAPECVYDMRNNTASSAGHLQLQNGDGKIRVEGDGFLWRQDDSFLTISNNVRTVIENEPAAPKPAGKDGPERKN